MFDSGVSAKVLVDTVKAEIDVASAITDNSFVQWINSTEQIIYTELIKELRKKVLTTSLASPIAITALTPAVGEQQPIFEDIYKIYAGSAELTPSSMVGAHVFSNSNFYWKDGTAIGYEIPSGTPTSITVFYRVRPALKTVTGSGVCTSNIALPVEWLDIMSCKLRGEAYQLANEDALAAKWRDDYNNAINQFKTWMQGKAVIYGE